MSGDVNDATISRLAATIAESDPRFIEAGSLSVDPEAQIKVVLSVAGEPVAIPVQKGERTETLVAEINRILEEARENGKLAELSNKYFGRDLTKEE